MIFVVECVQAKSYSVGVNRRVGIIMRRLLEEKGLRVKDLYTKTIGISRTKAHCHLTGDRVPSVDDRRQYAGLYGVPFEEFERQWQELPKSEDESDNPAESSTAAVLTALAAMDSTAQRSELSPLTTEEIDELSILFSQIAAERANDKWNKGRDSLGPGDGEPKPPKPPKPPADGKPTPKDRLDQSREDVKKKPKRKPPDAESA